MHESSLARQMLEAVLQRAREEGVARVRAVRGWVAESEALSRDGLGLHFTAQAQGTQAEGARLELELEHVRAYCRGCGYVYAPEHHVLLCPVCGGVEGELLGRTGLGITSMEVE